MIDVQINQVIAFSPMEPKVHDSKEAISLIEEAVRTSEKEGKRVQKVLADKGYDLGIFNRLREIGKRECK